MTKIIFASTAILLATALSTPVYAAEKKSGEAIFKEKCSTCHPNGGNVMKPSANLKGKKDAGKIIAKVRGGGGGMPVFDAKTISDADAKLLASYIIKTFKK